MMISKKYLTLILFSVIITIHILSSLYLVRPTSFTIYITNYSAIDPVDIQLYLDDNLVLNQDIYYIDSEHHQEFNFLIWKGIHNITLTSQLGKGRISVEVGISTDSFWGSFTFIGGNDPLRTFNYKVQAYPIEFA